MSSANWMPSIKEKQSAGQPVSEDEYQRLYELDVSRRQLQARIEESEAEPAEEPDRAKASRRLLATGGDRG